MPKLTDSSIKAAACPADKHRMELSDTACPGLILRVTRAGSKSFLFKYWSPLLSKSVSLTLGAYPALDLAGARDRIADHRKLIAKEKDPRAEQRHERQRFIRSEELTFNLLCDKYISEYAKGPGGEENPNKSSWKNDVGYLKKPRLHWGHLPANSITPDDAADLLDMIAETAPVGANRTQSILHTMFKWARQPGTKGRKLVTHNPISDLEQRGGKEKRRERVLNDVEIKTLWWGLEREDLPADRHTALGLKFILTTMVRPYQSAYADVSELLNLDGTDPEYHLPPKRVKRRRPVIVPLSELACEVLDEALEDKDRVVQKSDGSWAYFASDVAYFADKIERGYDRLINVLGADHHGYVARVSNALTALGLPQDRFEALLYQLVFITKGGVAVKSSKRAGNILTVDEILDEIDEAAGRKGAGSDALRFFFLSRSAGSNVEFDIELAKKKSLDNPVFYVQYGHARLSTFGIGASSTFFALANLGSSR